MDFSDTPDEAAFRASVRTWIGANAPWHLEPELRRSAFASSGVASQDPMAAAQAWQRTKAMAGYACLTWPKEYGGGGFTPIQRVIWQQEEGVFALLGMIFAIGHGMCGPTLIAWANDEGKSRWLPPLAKGDEVWCQLFSEPSAGSDLAGLRCSAGPAPDGSGDWIVSGQKIWTSNAHIADWGLLLTRSDPAVPKHKGLTMFVLDMRSPGVEVRPIRQANDGTGFSEVFLTEVRIPDSHRLGAAGGGWKVALTTLMNERMAIGERSTTGYTEILSLCSELSIGNGPAIEDRAVRSRLAHWAVRARGLEHTSQRAISALSRGDTPGPENAVGKLVAAELAHEIASFAIDLMGQGGMIADPSTAGAKGWFQAMLLRAPAMRIAGGTDEILRNVIAERVLGMPAEVRVDKDVPFNEIPQSSSRA
jgi:acyl-CoA dehydrogenase